MARPVRELEPASLSAAQARSYLAAIVQSSNDAIKAKTLDGTLVFWNDACERMYGYSAAEAIGRNVSFIIPAERSNELPEILARIAAGERVEHYETERVRKDGRRLDVSVSISPIRDERGRVVGAATIARDVSERKRTESAQRLLAATSRVFADAGLDPDRVVEGLCQATSATVADACVVQILDADGTRFRAAAVRDADGSVAAELRRVLTEHPLRSDEGLAGRIVATGEPVLVPDVGPDGRGLEAVVGRARPIVERLELRSLLGLPLRAYGRTVGALILGRRQPGRPYGDTDVPPLLEVAERAAMALEAAHLHQNLAAQADELRRLAEARDQARATAEHALARTALLARASVELSASLDYQTTLATVARLAVPGLADWCAVDVVDDGRIKRLATAHVDPAKVELADELERRYPTSPDAPTGVPAVIRTGRAELYPDIPDELLVAGTVDAEHLALARDLGLRSAIVAPMANRGRVFGALTLVWAESERRYDDGDLAAAEDLARRGAVAIDNARLYQAAEAARADAEAERDRLHQVVEELPEGVLVVDATGGVLLSNPVARTILGREPVGLVPDGGVIASVAWRPDGTVVRPDEFPIPRALVGATTRGEQLVVPHATEPRDVVLMVSATPLRDRAGAVTGAVAVFRDVTALRDLEQERDALLAAAAHDLKNPLGVIKAVAQLLLRRLQRQVAIPPERLTSSLTMIEQTATRMAQLVDELLDASRLRMGQPLALDRRRVDLVALARGLAAMFQESTETHQIVVSTTLPELVGVWDEARLGRVLANLLANAIKYSADGEIRIEVEQDGDDAVLHVRDRGIGIPAADLERIFQRYSRASNVGGVTGSGIGLAGSRKIVEQHGGTISVDSVEGSGSTFTIRLPRGGGPEIRSGT